jgi:hypothetical protein
MDHQRTVQDEKRQKLNSDFQKAWNDGEEVIKDCIRGDNLIYVMQYEYC